MPPGTAPRYKLFSSAAHLRILVGHLLLDGRIARTPTGPPRSVNKLRTRSLSCCAAAGALALLLLGVTGCRTGMKADLIARELRMQEDELYAMEDYLAQYQQLLRNCRAEKHALKRQLAELEHELPPPDRPPLQPPPRRPTPANEVLPTPRIEEPPTRPDDIQLPDVPGLEETTLDRPQARPSPAPGVSEPRREPPFDSVSGEPVGSEDVGRATIEQDEALQPGGTATHLWLHGEVVANDTDGGPRIVVDIEPRSPSGRATEFYGSLSLMVLAPGQQGLRSLARWDFSPDDTRAATKFSPTDQAMRFHLELPPDVASDQPTELWVRLLPAKGEKLLAHAAVDLQEPHRFSSAIGRPRAPGEERSREQRAARIAHRDPSRSPRSRPIDVEDGTWVVVQPGAVNPPPPRQDKASGQWRTTSEPLPTVAAPRATRSPAAVQQAAHLDAPKAVPPIRRETPSWSPDR